MTTTPFVWCSALSVHSSLSTGSLECCTGLAIPGGDFKLPFLAQHWSEVSECIMLTPKTSPSTALLKPTRALATLCHYLLLSDCGSSLTTPLDKPTPGLLFLEWSWASSQIKSTNGPIWSTASLIQLFNSSRNPVWSSATKNTIAITKMNLTPVIALSTDGWTLSWRKLITGENWRRQSLIYSEWSQEQTTSFGDLRVIE